MNSALKTESDFYIEARRASIVENIEKLTNSMLSDINIDMANMHCGIKKICHQEISWKDDHFWNELPNPHNYVKQKTTSNFQPAISIEGLPGYLKITQNKINTETKRARQDRKEELSRKFFCSWKNYVKNKKDHTKQLEKQIEQKEKLDSFLKSLKQYQSRKRRVCKTPTQLRCTLENQHNATHAKETNLNEVTKAKDKLPESSSYKHRFKAQQEIIQFQKEKLVKQEKLIQELKLGKLHEEITQSLEETQKDIQETLAKCSIKVRCKIKPAGIGAIQEDSLKFQVNSSKAPKIVQIMEERALERECKRQMILERKKILDQMKKQAIEMEIERKKVQDEEERKRNLEAIKETRKKELEIQRQIQLKKQKFLENCTKADNFYKRKLRKFVFKGFIKLVAMKQSNIAKSQKCYETKLKQKGLKYWIEFLKEIDYARYGKAEQLYHSKLKRKILRLWFKGYILSIQHLQVAEDLYEMRLQSKVFIHWHRYTCTQYVLQNKNLQKAQRHYDSRILLHYFYLWKSLPVVIQLEKAKEEKKRKWREKVWEILPDYKPVIDD